MTDTPPQPADDSVRDQAILAAQIARPLRAASKVASRCHLGLPVVAEVPPVLESGEPFPTRFWLTCPLARRRISRLEAAGGVRDMEARVAAEPDFAAALERAHARYAAARDALVPEGTKIAPRGGVAGVRKGVKCLHAHWADHRAGGENPVGAEVDAAVTPLDCDRPCVVALAPEAGGESDAVVRNAGWREP